MANYIVSYDLNGAVPTHAQMDAHVKTSGWANGRILETVWYIGTSASQRQVYDHFNSILSANDRLIVVTAANATWRNLLINDKSLLDAWQNNS